MEKAVTTKWTRERPRSRTRRHLHVFASLFPIRFVVIFAFLSLELRSGNRRPRFSRHIVTINESDAEKFAVYLVDDFFSDSIRRCPRFSSYVLERATGGSNPLLRRAGRFHCRRRQYANEIFAYERRQRIVGGP